MGGTAAVRSNAYGPLNRVITQTDPQSFTVGHAYDPADSLTALTDSRSLATGREVDGFGEVIEEISPDRGTRSYWYDLGSNLIQLVDGDGVLSTYSYDYANRLTARSFPAASSQNIAYAYDSVASGNQGVGRLTGVTDASGSTAFTYDGQGRVVYDSKVISGGGFSTPLVVSYGYDANGKVIQIRYPSGDVVNIIRASDGLPAGFVETLSGGSPSYIAAGVAYEPYGPITGFAYGAGLNLARTYDADYRLTGIDVAAGGTTIYNLAFGWQADGRIASVTDPASLRTASYAYTGSGRAMTANGPRGNYSYTYHIIPQRSLLTRNMQSRTISANVQVRPHPRPGATA